jgi:dTDP-4-amino-4,6-dideoxy-D-galactose acyltransferase
MSAKCEYLDWDSGFFGLRIARLHGLNLDNDGLKSALFWCKNNQIDCLYYLADPTDLITIHLLQERNFCLVDIRTTLAQILKSKPKIETVPKIITRAGDFNDVPSLRKLASENHTQTRFFNDPNFGVEKARLLYSTWIENSIRGYADIVMIAEDMNKISGYITGHLNSDGSGQIGLVGVSKSMRGYGIGELLIRTILFWFYQHGVEKIQVVAQGSNIPALYLYQKTGFFISSVQLWYHKWFI